MEMDMQGFEDMRREPAGSLWESLVRVLVEAKRGGSGRAPSEKAL